MSFIVMCKIVQGLSYYIILLDSGNVKYETLVRKEKQNEKQHNERQEDKHEK
jgi:hypothetical protein